MKANVKANISKYKSLIGLVLLCIVITIVTPNFLSVSNITNVFTQVSVNAIIAIGMTFVILTGGIDLSVGSTLAISGAVGASIVKSTGNVFLAIIVAAVIGIAVGLINGLLVKFYICISLTYSGENVTVYVEIRLMNGRHNT